MEKTAQELIVKMLAEHERLIWNDAIEEVANYIRTLDGGWCARDVWICDQIRRLKR